MKLRGFSARCFHGPSQRALVLDSLSFKPDKIPNSFSMSKAFWTDIRSLHYERGVVRKLANFKFLMEDKMPQIELSCCILDASISTDKISR